MPGEAVLDLTLPADSAPPAPDVRWGAKLAAAHEKLPHTPDGWQIAATRTPKSVTLTARPPVGTNFTPAGFHFFADDGLIAYDLPQPVSEHGGVFAFTLRWTTPVRRRQTSCRASSRSAKATGLESGSKFRLAQWARRKTPNSKPQTPNQPAACPARSCWRF